MPPDLTLDPTEERRWGPRVDLFQAIACEGEGEVVRSAVGDLSVGGMFVDTPHAPASPPGAASASGSGSARPRRRLPPPPACATSA